LASAAWQPKAPGGRNKTRGAGAAPEARAGRRKTREEFSGYGGILSRVSEKNAPPEQILRRRQRNVHSAAGAPTACGARGISPQGFGADNNDALP